MEDIVIPDVLIAPSELKKPTAPSSLPSLSSPHSASLRFCSWSANEMGYMTCAFDSVLAVMSSQLRRLGHLPEFLFVEHQRIEAFHRLVETNPVASRRVLITGLQRLIEAKAPVHRLPLTGAGRANDVSELLARYAPSPATAAAAGVPAEGREASLSDVLDLFRVYRRVDVEIGHSDGSTSTMPSEFDCRWRTSATVADHIRSAWRARLPAAPAVPVAPVPPRADRAVGDVLSEATASADMCLAVSQPPASAAAASAAGSESSARAKRLMALLAGEDDDDYTDIVMTESIPAAPAPPAAEQRETKVQPLPPIPFEFVMQRLWLPSRVVSKDPLAILRRVSFRGPLPWFEVQDEDLGHSVLSGLVDLSGILHPFALGQYGDPYRVTAIIFHRLVDQHYYSLFLDLAGQWYFYDSLNGAVPRPKTLEEAQRIVANNRVTYLRCEPLARPKPKPMAIERGIAHALVACIEGGDGRRIDAALLRPDPLADALACIAVEMGFPSGTVDHRVFCSLFREDADLHQALLDSKALQQPFAAVLTHWRFNWDVGVLIFTLTARLREWGPPDWEPQLHEAVGGLVDAVPGLVPVLRGASGRDRSDPALPDVFPMLAATPHRMDELCMAMRELILAISRLVYSSDRDGRAAACRHRLLGELRLPCKRDCPMRIAQCDGVGDRSRATRQRQAAEESLRHQSATLLAEEKRTSDERERLAAVAKASDAAQRARLQESIDAAVSAHEDLGESWDEASARRRKTLHRRMDASLDRIARLSSLVQGMDELPSADARARAEFDATYGWGGARTSAMAAAAAAACVSGLQSFCAATLCDCGGIDIRPRLISKPVPMPQRMPAAAAAAAAAVASLPPPPPRPKRARSNDKAERFWEKYVKVMDDSDVSSLRRHREAHRAASEAAVAAAEADDAAAEASDDEQGIRDTTMNNCDAPDALSGEEDDEEEEKDDPDAYRNARVIREAERVLGAVQTAVADEKKKEKDAALSSDDSELSEDDGESEDDDSGDRLGGGAFSAVEDTLKALGQDPRFEERVRFGRDFVEKARALRLANLQSSAAPAAVVNDEKKGVSAAAANEPRALVAARSIGQAVQTLRGSIVAAAHGPAFDRKQPMQQFMERRRRAGGEALTKLLQQRASDPDEQLAIVDEFVASAAAPLRSDAEVRRANKGAFRSAAEIKILPEAAPFFETDGLSRAVLRPLQRIAERFKVPGELAIVFEWGAGLSFVSPELDTLLNGLASDCVFRVLASRAAEDLRREEIEEKKRKKSTERKSGLALPPPVSLTRDDVFGAFDSAIDKSERDRGCHELDACSTVLRRFQTAAAVTLAARSMDVQSALNVTNRLVPMVVNPARVSDMDVDLGQPLSAAEAAADALPPRIVRPLSADEQRAWELLSQFFVYTARAVVVEELAALAEAERFGAQSPVSFHVFLRQLRDQSREACSTLFREAVRAACTVPADLIRGPIVDQLEVAFANLPIVRKLEERARVRAKDLRLFAVTDRPQQRTTSATVTIMPVQSFDSTLHTNKSFYGRASFLELPHISVREIGNRLGRRMAQHHEPWINQQLDELGGRPNADTKTAAAQPIIGGLIELSLAERESVRRAFLRGMRHVMVELDVAPVLDCFVRDIAEGKVAAETVVNRRTSLLSFGHASGPLNAAGDRFRELVLMHVLYWTVRVTLPSVSLARDGACRPGPVSSLLMRLDQKEFTAACFPHLASDPVPFTPAALDVPEWAASISPTLAHAVIRSCLLLRAPDDPCLYLFRQRLAPLLELALSSIAREVLSQSDSDETRAEKRAYRPDWFLPRVALAFGDMVDIVIDLLLRLGPSASFCASASASASDPALPSPPAFVEFLRAVQPRGGWLLGKAGHLREKAFYGITDVFASKRNDTGRAVQQRTASVTASVIVLHFARSASQSLLGRDDVTLPPLLLELATSPVRDLAPNGREQVCIFMQRCMDRLDPLLVQHDAVAEQSITVIEGKLPSFRHTLGRCRALSFLVSASCPMRDYFLSATPPSVSVSMSQS